MVETLVALALMFLLGVVIVMRGDVLAEAAHTVTRDLATGRLHAVVGGRWRCIAAPADRAVRVGWPGRGLAFTPSGMARTCDGGGVGNTTILLEHRGRQAAVIVSSLGRVRWEMR